MIKVSTFCSGIGAAEQAIKNLNVEHKVVFACEIDKYARATYEANHDAELMIHDMCEPDYIGEQYYSDINVSGLPCFKAGTLITTDSGLVPIEQIKKGDFVLTHKNRFCEVVIPMVKQSKSILNIKIQGSPLLEATSEHPFYVREMSRKWNNNRRCDERVFSEPKWVAAKDLIAGKHFVGFGMNTKSENIYNLNKEECWFLGRYMADGYLTSRGKRTKTEERLVYKISLCIGYAKVDSFPSFKTIKTSPIKERTVTKFHTYNQRLHGLCLEIGCGSENKQIPGFIMDLPIDLLSIFIEGYLSGDGSVRDEKYSLTTVSKKLAYSFSQAVYKCYNTPASITFTKRPLTTIIEGRTVNQKDTYYVQFYKETRKQNNGIFIDGNIWQPVKSVIENTEYNNLVYNFEVSEDNSYVAENCIVHNCQAFSLAGKRLGELDKRGLLFYDFYRYIKNQQPKIFIIENVKGLLSQDNGKTFQNWLQLLGRSLNTMEQLYIHEDSLEYNLHYQVLNSKDFGVPQNRERIFIVGIRKDLPNNFRFPIGWKLDKRLRDVLEIEVEEKYYLSEKMIAGFLKHNLDTVEKNRGFKFEPIKDTYKEIASTVTARYFKMGVDDNYIQEPFCVAMRGRNPENPSDRTTGANLEQTLEANSQGITNTISTVQKDNLIVEPQPIPLLELLKLLDDSTDEPQIHQKGRGYNKGGLHDICPPITSNSFEQNNLLVEGNDWILGGLQEHQTPRTDGICPTLTSAMGMGGGQTPIVKPNQRIRRLTPLECFRLQAFSDEFFYKAKAVNSDTQLYKQAGNTITVTVIKAIINNLLHLLK